MGLFCQNCDSLNLLSILLSRFVAKSLQLEPSVKNSTGDIIVIPRVKVAQGKVGRLEEYGVPAFVMRRSAVQLRPWALLLKGIQNKRQSEILVVYL